jgi:hypothetical protein
MVNHAWILFCEFSGATTDAETLEVHRDYRNSTGFGDCFVIR